MYLVTCTTKNEDGTYKDYCFSAESFYDAKLIYEPLLEIENLYMASISKVIESTDY
jgi:hypothetical protein